MAAAKKKKAVSKKKTAKKKKIEPKVTTKKKAPRLEVGQVYRDIAHWDGLLLIEQVDNETKRVTTRLFTTLSVDEDTFTYDIASFQATFNELVPLSSVPKNVMKRIYELPAKFKAKESPSLGADVAVGQVRRELDVGVWVIVERIEGNVVYGRRYSAEEGLWDDLLPFNLDSFRNNYSKVVPLSGQPIAVAKRVRELPTPHQKQKQGDDSRVRVNKEQPPLEASQIRRASDGACLVVVEQFDDNEVSYRTYSFEQGRSGLSIKCSLSEFLQTYNEVVSKGRYAPTPFEVGQVRQCSWTVDTTLYLVVEVEISSLGGYVTLQRWDWNDRRWDAVRREPAYWIHRLDVVVPQRYLPTEVLSHSFFKGNNNNLDKEDKETAKRGIDRSSGLLKKMGDLQRELELTKLELSVGRNELTLANALRRACELGKKASE